MTISGDGKAWARVQEGKERVSTCGTPWRQELMKDKDPRYDRLTSPCMLCDHMTGFGDQTSSNRNSFTLPLTCAGH
jgi:hypothetical protein